jgi:hypothetical protein
MRILRITATIFLLPILFAPFGCSQNRAQKKLDSGIEGKVLLGPMSAVVNHDKPMPDKPYKATIKVLNPNREQIAQFETDEAGRFKVALEPGEYIISPIAPNTPQTPGSLQVPKPPYPEEQKVKVKPGEYAQIIVRYDTGLR